MARNDWKARLKALDPCPEAYKWAVKHKTLREAWRMCERGDWMEWLMEPCEPDNKVIDEVLEAVRETHTNSWGTYDGCPPAAELYLQDAYIILDFMPEQPELPELCQE